jgi:hypothetical protein
MSSDRPVDERLVAHVWERQAFQRAALDDLGLSVIFRGLPSDAGGPDYQEAVLVQTGRAVVSGDVEFHVFSSDWYRHGHHRDRRYNHVVLHVVWTDDVGVTERADGETVPVLALSGCVSDGAIGDFAAPRARLMPHPCVAAFSALSSESLRSTLRDLGLFRFRERAETFSASVTAQGADQAIYTGLLEALGYASNRDRFRELADVLPFAWLGSLSPDLQAPALLDAAGLGPACGVDMPARLPAGTWRLSRIRPTNHPARRLEGLAELLASLMPSPADSLAGTVEGARGPADLRRALMSGQGRIGAGRADEMAISVVLPFLGSLPRSCQPAERLFLHYPPAPSNRWTRVMQGMFEEAGHAIKPKSAAEHQGIHHLYHRHCRYERFSGCPVCGVSRAQAAGSTGAMSYQS